MNKSCIGMLNCAQWGNCSSTTQAGDLLFSDGLTAMLGSLPMVFVDGALMHDVGDGVVTGCAIYWSEDGGASAISFNTTNLVINAGCKLYRGDTFPFDTSSANKIMISYSPG